MKSPKQQTPPKWMVSFFIWCSKPADVDDLIGDMEEIYQLNRQKKSAWSANYRFFRHTIALLFSYTVKKRKRAKKLQYPRSTQNNGSMYLNYLKMVLRGLNKQRSFTIINILGLSLGLGLSFMILLYVQSEMSYDRFHEDATRTYRITKSYSIGEEVVETSRLRYYLIPPMKENIPEIEDYSSIKPIEEELTFEYGKKEFDEGRVAFVDENFFSFFSFQLKSGNPEKLLTAPSSIVISKTMADKYFGGNDPFGETIRIALKSNHDKYFQAKVTGVFEDMPKNSHFHMDFLLSKSTIESDARNLGLRGLAMQHNYIKLLPNQHIEEVNKKLPYIEENYAPSFFKTAGMHLHTQPLTDIHLRSHLENEFEANGNIDYVYLLSFVGIFILLIASFNYMNLATSNALERAKEVGVRKVMGSKRSQLIARFFTESISIAFISFLLSTGLVYLGLPYFNQLSGKQLYFSFSQHFNLGLYFIGISLIIGLISGVYPALYLSRFKVIKSLKGTVSKHGKGTRIMRKSLVTVQFVISVTLIICTMVVFNQLDYLRSKDLGFDTETIITIDSESEAINDNYHVLKEELLANPNIKAVAGANRQLITDFDLGVTNGISIAGIDEPIGMNYVFIDEDFFELYDIQLKSGHYFEHNNTQAIILNESAVERINSNTHDVLGLNIHLYDGFDPQVIGVVEDFHFESLHRKIGPMYFQFFESNNTGQRLKSISIKLLGKNLGETLRSVENTFAKSSPNLVFNFRFLDDRIERAYENEKRFTLIFGIFSGLAIFMACMGVFGLSVQAAISKRKEISIRKVLGASMTSIMHILTRELLMLVLLANIIAWPIAYAAMNRWLQDFPYRESIRIELFIPILIGTLLLTFLSIISRVLQTARLNPSDSLKTE